MKYNRPDFIDKERWINNNKSCIEMLNSDLLNKQSYPINNNKSCIEMRQGRTQRLTGQMINNNKSCIEIGT